VSRNRCPTCAHQGREGIISPLVSLRTKMSPESSGSSGGSRASACGVTGRADEAVEVGDVVSAQQGRHRLKQLSMVPRRGAFSRRGRPSHVGSGVERGRGSQLGTTATRGTRNTSVSARERGTVNEPLRFCRRTLNPDEGRRGRSSNVERDANSRGIAPRAAAAPFP